MAPNGVDGTHLLGGGAANYMFLVLPGPVTNLNHLL